jgi:hypothetical protein
MRLAFPTDEHFPFQDEEARSVALRIVSDFDPDLRITGSDSLDFYNISKFDKDPKRFGAGLQAEIDAWSAGEREWKDASPHAKVKWINSNHVDRLRKYIWQHPEIADLRALSLPNLLGMDEKGIEHDPEGDYANNEVVIEGKLVVKHGSFVRKFSAMSARAEMDGEFNAISILTGHTHRGGTYHVTTRNGIVTAQECFCLCKLDPPFMQHPNWQQGIVLAEIVNGIVSIEPILIRISDAGRVAVWRGKEYRSE